jgi:transcription-repair coupling factor (superfamily II helicase)
VAKTKEARGTAGALKKSKGSPRSTISSSSPLGMLALHLLEQWRQSGRGGIVFLAENENRAERLGSVLHSLDPSLDVLVFPRLYAE